LAILTQKVSIVLVFTEQNRSVQSVMFGAQQAVCKRVRHGSRQPQSTQRTGYTLTTPVNARHTGRRRMEIVIKPVLSSSMLKNRALLLRGQNNAAHHWQCASR